ncbi:hypothetical protein CYMTET_44857 [Cymbomonas tetramitiformis]|uniref:Uncharacterized protein n=1 Tax=Cymbomonas tetramitiformis TaxID=36881 RepID=A0AAE0BZD5_9CHLO|nr:hypothetical protein CYMTET_44857 [Cymbomonas tetramitiformis]
MADEVREASGMKVADTDIDIVCSWFHARECLSRRGLPFSRQVTNGRSTRDKSITVGDVAKDRTVPLVFMK